MAGGALDITLAAIAGPIGGAFDVRGDQPVSIGRAAGSDICLVHEGVSRRHASLVPRDGAWHVVDHQSTGGTFLGGVRLEPGRATVIGVGDQLKIGPCAFRCLAPSGTRGVGTSGSGVLGTLVDVPDAASARRVERAARVAAGPGSVDSGLERVSGLVRSDRRLRLLSEGLARLSRMTDEVLLARTALEIALAGSGYRWGAVLRAGVADASGHAEADQVEVFASIPHDSRAPTGNAGARPATPATFSRSLVRRAAGGEIVLLTEDRLPDLSADQFGHSIAEMRIHSALCAPVFLGEVVEAYLYLESRGEAGAVSDDALGYCDAVARAYGLAAANLKRAELQRRQSRLQLDLDAAREAQQMILPEPRGDMSFLSYAMKSVPGQFVAGDMFNVIELCRSGSVAICLGDVAGHGVASALVMSALQAHMHAQIVATEDPRAAVESLNEYLSHRSAAGRFASLWVGVFARNGTLRFVDAGHGHWLVRRRAGAGGVELTGGGAGGAPVGIAPDYRYPAQEVTLAPGDQIVLYSDGIVEQRGSDRTPFGLERLRHLLRDDAGPVETVERIFTSVSNHAGFSGPASFDDDASAAVIEFRSA
ncbi:MAG: SpoIIE family protein phosphatase [Phycisphaerales bacterium]